MSLKGILAISGLPGLYKVVAQTKNGFIVESFIDKKRLPVSSTQRITMLEDITMYCIDRDATLKEVMLKMKENDTSASAITPKADNDQLKKFFLTILPEYDQDRVYASDIQKVIKWYQALKDQVTFEDEPAYDNKEEALAEEIKEANVDIDKNLKSKKAHKDDLHSKAGLGLGKASSEKKVASVKTRKKV